MSSLEAIQTRHRKELKDLQSRITQKKKQATKKTRKGVNDECAELERALRERQDAELAALDGGEADIVDASDHEEDLPPPDSPPPTVNAVANTLQNATLEPAEAQRPRRNRQKERLARRAAEVEAEAVKAEAEAALLPNWKRRESRAMERAFLEHGLKEEEIRADGHCLYSSIADQMTQLGRGEDGGYKAVRKRAAKWIQGHAGDFEGFLEEPLAGYVRKIEETAEWGGHVELMALARSYGVEICVVQDGRVDTFAPGEREGKGEVDRIWLAYYHHGYGLGEHYNSLRKAKTP